MLYSYGIQDEKSDMRAHVSPWSRTVYLFSPQAARKAIKQHPEIRPRKAYQKGVNGATAMGYPMPIEYIDDMQAIGIPSDTFKAAKFSWYDNPAAKGNKAVYVITEMLKRNLIPLALDIQEITDRTLQISGTDIFVSAKCRIQVKCDWKVGKTKNVYLQTHERNPLKMF